MATQINININGFGTHLNGAPRSGSLRDRCVSGYSERVIDTEPVTRWQDEFYTLKPGFSPVGYLHAERKLKKKKKKNCSNGQVCGFSCISKSKTCTANMTTAQFMEHNKAKRLAAAEKRKAAKAVKAAAMVSVEPQTYQEAIEKGRQVIAEFAPQLDKLSQAFDSNQAQIDKLSKKIDSLNKKAKKIISTNGEKSDYLKAVEESRQLFEERYALRKQQEALVKDAAENVMPLVRQSLMSKMPPDEARRKAEQTRMGNSVTPEHNPSRIMEAAAEFHSLTGGRVNIEYFAYTDDRAYASPEKKISESISAASYVNVGYARHNPSRVIFHEMAHHIEYSNHNIAQIAADWRDSRATGKPRKLNKLDPKKNYDDKEVAVPDKFIDPYVGKVYPRITTEVISMGVEHLSSPGKMAELYAVDKEHFLLTVGIL